MMRDSSIDEWIEQQIGDVVAQGAADQKLHRQVIDTLWVLSVVGFRRPDPALRQDISDGERRRGILLPRAGGGGRYNIVKQQVTLIESVMARELNRAAAIPFQKICRGLPRLPRLGRCCLAVGHLGSSTSYATAVG